jgi:hypothetical protein
VQGLAGGPGYKAQNNTQSVITDPDTIVRFQTELITEHMTVSSVARSGASGYSTSKPLSRTLTPAAQAIEDHVRAVTAAQRDSAASAGGSKTTAKKTAPKKAAPKKVTAKKAQAKKTSPHTPIA